ncbi:MAG: gliding motility-associated C-terminal domain-containing protein, partial [Chitinophagales bacterium]
YINIWYVTDIKSEIMAFFSCGQWSRIKEDGYATMPPASDSLDGIVLRSFGHLLAHEMGHYLGLYHTFEGLNCANTNCSVDGDKVCDTPPDASIGNSLSCTQPQNSCSSDTLSGFTVDMPDMISNFMDYGNDACHNAFTEGQAARMRSTIASFRSGLIQDECTKACPENSVALFIRDNPYPVPGSLVGFTNLSTGAGNYQWLINDVVISSTANFSYHFAANGKYKVTLKAFNGNSSCFASYTDYIIVNCGTVSRFYPDKRVIASKIPIYPDSIYFTNRSVGAISYQWLMSNDQGMTEQLVSSATDLSYTFAVPGDYKVRLVASNGSCVDTSEAFEFKVRDPTPDGVVYIYNVNCYQQTGIKLQLEVCNGGYAPILPNTPISFYDDDPRKGNAHKLDPGFVLRDTIKGACCGYTYDHILNINRAGLNQLYVVFNDSGNTMPLSLPNTSQVELNYLNNIQFLNNFQYHVSIAPSTATLKPGDTLQLIANATPGSTKSFIWSSAKDISCTDCSNPILIADSDITKMVIATSEYDCVDTAYTEIKVPPADDYTISLSKVVCTKQDSLQIDFRLCNQFSRGIIPKGLMVSFYDADPSSSNAHLLGPVFITNESMSDTCVSYAYLIKRTGATNLFAVVNDNGRTIPLKLPNDSSLKENNYSNNSSNLNYTPDSLLVEPADTSVSINQSFPLIFQTSLQDPASVNWIPGEGYVLSCNQCNSPVVTVHAYSVVKLEIISQQGCTLTGQSVIRIFSGGSVSIPNAFTPNGDGKNDRFYVLGGRDVVSILEFSIFDRWGGKVFQSKNVSPNDPASGWNGTYGGETAEPGTYVYFVKILFSNGSQQLFKGTVTLIR